MKQELPIKGLELFLNASNLTETSDISRYRGDIWWRYKLKQFYKNIDLGFRYSFDNEK